MHFVPFGCIRNRLVALRKRAELLQMFVPRSRIRIFRNERTRSTHWTLNRHFRAIHTIWVHLGPFGCHTKLDAKRAEVVLKFVP